MANVKKYRIRDAGEFMRSSTPNIDIAKFINNRDFYLSNLDGDGAQVLSFDRKRYAQRRSSSGRMMNMWFSKEEIQKYLIPLDLIEPEDKNFYVFGTDENGERRVTGSAMTEVQAKTHCELMFSIGWTDLVILKKHLVAKETKTITWE